MQCKKNKNKIKYKQTQMIAEPWLRHIIRIAYFDLTGIRWPEQRRASARDMYRANLESNRASKRWRQEKNYVAVQASNIRGGVVN